MKPVRVETASSLREYIWGFLGWPIEYEERRPVEPFATWGLAFACVSFSLIGWIFSLDSATAGFVPAEPFRYFGLTVVSSFLMHANIFHLIANVYFLLILGDNVEDLLGWKNYLLFLLLASFFGNFVDFFIRFGSPNPSLGASGGIAALITFYGFQFRSNRLSLAPWRALAFYGQYYSLRAPYFALLWVFLQILGLIFSSLNINYATHLAGASIGFLAYLRNKFSGKDLHGA